MEKKLASYANGFNLMVNKGTGEAIITFLQLQPGFNPESGSFDLVAPAEVSAVIIPFFLAEQLSNTLKECIEKENAAETSKE